MMKLCDERAQFFEKGDPDGFEIRLRFPIRLKPRIFRGNVLEILVQANRLGIGGELPLGCTEKHANMTRVEVHDARRNRIGFDGLIDRSKDDGLSRYVNDDAATGQIGDDFLFTLSILRVQRRTQASRSEQNSDDSVEELTGLRD